jgi:hypothetical protein
MLRQAKIQLQSVAMKIRQVEPSSEAAQGLPEGDRLFHFFAESSEGKGEYFIAVHLASDGSIRTACQCMSAIFNFARRLEPCCKHAAEARKIVEWEIRGGRK